MNARRRGAWIGLIAAVVALLLSVGLATAYAANGQRWPWVTSSATAANGAASPSGVQSPGWSSGGMMGGDPGGWNDGRRWNDGGMMGGWNDGGKMGGRNWNGSGGSAGLTRAQSQHVAQAWLNAHQPDATVENAGRTPGGYVFTVTKSGQVVGTLMVNDATGAVGWWPTGSASSPWSQPTP